MALPVPEGGAALVALTALRTHADAANPQLDAENAQKSLSRQAEGDVAAYVEQVRHIADVKKNPKAFE